MPFPVDIASRDPVTMLPLLTKKISAQTYHFSVPARNTQTFLVAEADADQELLAGKLNVYFGKIQRDTVVRSLAYKISAENIKDTSESGWLHHKPAAPG